MSEFNIDLLREAIRWAIAEFKKEQSGGKGAWKQGDWASGPIGQATLRDAYGDLYRRINVSCGTSFCVAGNVCATMGDRFVVEAYDADPGDTVDVNSVIPKGEKRVYDIEDRATALLGITVGQAGQLFDGSNTIAEVVSAARDIAVSHGEVLFDADELAEALALSDDD